MVGTFGLGLLGSTSHSQISILHEKKPPQQAVIQIKDRKSTLSPIPPLVVLKSFGQNYYPTAEQLYWVMHVFESQYMNCSTGSLER
jgi:hypothetical protein